MFYYLLGVISILAVSIFIWTIKRKGGHNESGIDDNIKREGILNKRIEKLQGKLLVVRSEISGARERIAQAEDRVRSTDSLINDIKKRNGLG